MTKLFISYKRGRANTLEAEALYDGLADQGYSVFLDKNTFQGGEDWDEEIYKNISESDALILLLQEGTSESIWVQREVDFARGSRVSILPVVLNSVDKANAGDTLFKLAIYTRNYTEAVESSDPTIRYGNILKAIPGLAEKTRYAQKAWVNYLQDKWKKEDEANAFKPTTPKYASYAFFPNPRHAHECTLHLTAGSITEIRGVDVLVNSENVYMQMQRVFDRESVSKRIRLDGAKINGDHYINRDTIQEELNEQLFGQNGNGVPVSQGTVIVTSAGGSNSKLSQRKIRYVFHVAVVDANTEEQVPVKNPDKVKISVRNCLERITEINLTQPPVTSIIFPVLASGNAGLALPASAQAILEACKEFLYDNEQTQLKDIYLVAYMRSDLYDLVKLFDTYVKRQELRLLQIQPDKSRPKELS